MSEQESGDSVNFDGDIDCEVTSSGKRVSLSSRTTDEELSDDCSSEHTDEEEQLCQIDGLEEALSAQRKRWSEDEPVPPEEHVDGPSEEEEEEGQEQEEEEDGQEEEEGEEGDEEEEEEVDGDDDCSSASSLASSTTREVRKLKALEKIEAVLCQDGGARTFTASDTRRIDPQNDPSIDTSLRSVQGDEFEAQLELELDQPNSSDEEFIDKDDKPQRLQRSTNRRMELDARNIINAPRLRASKRQAMEKMQTIRAALAQRKEDAKLLEEFNSKLLKRARLMK